MACSFEVTTQAQVSEKSYPVFLTFFIYLNHSVCACMCHDALRKSEDNLVELVPPSAFVYNLRLSQVARLPW